MEKKILPLKYLGQEVFTSGQLVVIFDSTKTTLNSIFRYYRGNFIEGEDYYKIAGAELRRFKMENQHAGNSYSQDEGNSDAPIGFPKTCNSLILWTKVGALKVSKYVGTDEAKAMYVLFALEAGVGKNDAPRVVNSVAPPEKLFTTDEKLKYLMEMAKLTADETLREECLQTAFKLLTE